MKLLNIVIDDENRYFSSGLRLSIAKYARQHNKTPYDKGNAIMLGLGARCGRRCSAAQWAVM